MICAGQVVVPVARVSEVWRLYALGDCHLGNQGCAVDKLAADVEEIRRDKFAKVLLMGDLADYIGPSDRRWDATQIPDGARVKDLADWGAFLRDLCVKTFKPIAGKIIGALSGNHEASFSAQQAQQQHAAFCSALKVPDFGYSCFFDLSFRKASRMAAHGPCRTYRVFAHHGAGAAQSAGGKINRLVRFMDAMDAEVYLCGHVHEKDTKQREYLAADRTCTHLIDKKKLGVFSGTYLRTYSPGTSAGYGERAGYSPVPLGCSVVEFHPFTREWESRYPSVSARVAI